MVLFEDSIHLNAVEKCAPKIPPTADEMIVISSCRFMIQVCWKVQVAHLKLGRRKSMLVMCSISAQ